MCANTKLKPTVINDLTSNLSLPELLAAIIAPAQQAKLLDKWTIVLVLIVLVSLTALLLLGQILKRPVSYTHLTLPTIYSV